MATLDWRRAEPREPPEPRPLGAMTSKRSRFLAWRMAQLKRDAQARADRRSDPGRT